MILVIMGITLQKMLSFIEGLRALLLLNNLHEALHLEQIHTSPVRTRSAYQSVWGCPDRRQRCSATVGPVKFPSNYWTWSLSGMPADINQTAGQMPTPSITEDFIVDVEAGAG